MQSDRNKIRRHETGIRLCKVSWSNRTGYSVNLDGSGREKVCGFYGDRVADSVMSSIVVGDHCYVHMSYEQDRNGSDVDGVYRVSLKDGTA